jgi:hypothetical protein
MNTLKKIAKWTGVVLIGACGVVLLGGGKITSGTLMIVTAFLLVVLAGKHLVPRWIGIVLVCAVLGLVAWNISTTDLPGEVSGNAMACTEVVDTPETGIKFLDQVLYIFGGFAAQAEP